MWCGSERMSVMASATTENDEKAMASDLALPGDDEGSSKPRGSAPPQKSKDEDGKGFFHIYKSGQGYWTRMGTVGAALL